MVSGPPPDPVGNAGASLRAHTLGYSGARDALGRHTLGYSGARDVNHDETLGFPVRRPIRLVMPAPAFCFPF